MTQTGQPAGFPGLLDPNVVLRRHVEDVSARFAGTVSPETVERMVFESCAALGRTARGMTVTDALPKPLTDDVVQAADMVITMGRGDACPVYPGKRYLDWHVTDPAGQPLAVVDAIATDIETRVRGLLAGLRSSTTLIDPGPPPVRGAGRTDPQIEEIQ